MAKKKSKRVSKALAIVAPVSRPESKTRRLRAEAEESGDTRMARAHAVWDGLPMALQRQLAREIVEARTEEIRSAYPAVIEIAHGFRTVHRDGKRTVLDEPCVVLMVGRKWRATPKGAKAQRRAVPRYLLTHTSFGPSGLRQLCAVPTDVESGVEYRVKPHVLQRRTVDVEDPSGDVPTQEGVLTCKIRLVGSDTVFVLSCHHVIAMSNTEIQPGSAVDGAMVRLPGAADIAEGTGFRGRLVPSHQGTSFDAALASVTGIEATDDALGLVRLAGVWPLPDMPHTATVETPHGEARVRFIESWSNFSRIDYAVPDVVQVTVVEWQVESGFTQAGDSGSPVIDANGLLLGMHIGGTPSGRAFMLPANELFWGPNMGVPGALELVNS